MIDENTVKQISKASVGEICEALVRKVESSGHAILEKNYKVDGGANDGEIICSVWCVTGPKAKGFVEMARSWLVSQEYEVKEKNGDYP